MRTESGRVAGSGVTLAFYEPEDNYHDHKVSVRLPHDNAKGAERASLSGPVITYNLYDRQPDK